MFKKRKNANNFRLVQNPGEETDQTELVDSDKRYKDFINDLALIYPKILKLVNNYGNYSIESHVDIHGHYYEPHFLVDYRVDEVKKASDIIRAREDEENKKLILDNQERLKKNDEDLLADFRGTKRVRKTPDVK